MPRERNRASVSRRARLASAPPQASPASRPSQQLQPGTAPGSSGGTVVEDRDARWVDHPWSFQAKRIVDFVGASVGLVLLLPVLLLIAALIRLDSPGPIFFRQQRLGLGGRPFRIWKFRSMYRDAEARLKELQAQSDDPIMFKMRNDPRVTRVGRFLRQTSLDELPQLLNVITGTMSLVGPRPLPIKDCDRLREAYPESFTLRHAVLPGMTGAWQVVRHDVSAEEMVELDRDYLADWNFWLDLWLIARTAITVVIGRGAYA